MFFNKLRGWYGRFSVLLFLMQAGYCKCKNEMASKQIDFMLAKKASKSSTASNPQAFDQSEDSAASKSNGEGPSNDAVEMASSDPYENVQDQLEQTDQVDRPPSFTLQEITLKAGAQQSTRLAVAGSTAELIIKSISVTKNGTYYTKDFGVTKLNKKSIPSAGLPITLTPDGTLPVGSYELKIKIGKRGKGSRKTEQWVKSMIHIIKDETKNDKQNEPYHATEAAQPLNSEVLSQNDCPSQDQTDASEHIQAHPAQKDTPPAEPSFVLKDVTLQAGTQQSTILAVAGNTEGLIIQSISVSQNKSYYTSKFGVGNLKNKPIPPAGLPVTLTPDLTLKAGSYQLKIKIGKREKGSGQKAEWVACMIHVKA